MGVTMVLMSSSTIAQDRANLEASQHLHGHGSTPVCLAGPGTAGSHGGEHHSGDAFWLEQNKDDDGTMAMDRKRLGRGNVAQLIASRKRSSRRSGMQWR